MRKPLPTLDYRFKASVRGNDEHGDSIELVLRVNRGPEGSIVFEVGFPCCSAICIMPLSSARAFYAAMNTGLEYAAEPCDHPLIKQVER